MPMLLFKTKLVTVLVYPCSKYLSSSWKAFPFQRCWNVTFEC